jgi:hypothetical protein
MSGGEVSNSPTLTLVLIDTRTLTSYPNDLDGPLNEDVPDKIRQYHSVYYNLGSNDKVKRREV